MNSVYGLFSDGELLGVYRRRKDAVNELEKYVEWWVDVAKMLSFRFTDGAVSISSPYDFHSFIVSVKELEVQ